MGVNGGGAGGLTTLRVPIRTLGGTVFEETMSEMKLAVMPMMAMREMPWRARTTVKVAPRAPYCGAGIMVGFAKERFAKFVFIRSAFGKLWFAVRLRKSEDCSVSEFRDVRIVVWKVARWDIESIDGREGVLSKQSDRDMYRYDMRFM